MHIPDGFLEKLLRGNNKITFDQLSVLKQQEIAEKKSLQELVVQSNIISDQELTKLYAGAIGIPFIELSPHTVDKHLIALIPERLAKQYRAIVFEANIDGSHKLAMEDPDDIQAINVLQKQIGSQLHIYAAPASAITAALDLYHSSTSNELTKVLSPDDMDEEESLVVDDTILTEDSPITQTVNLLIRYAVKAGASDIHIEPREKYVSVRYRVDGILSEVNKLPKKVHSAVISRVKILSNLKIDERRVPQDGRFKIDIDGQIYAMRVSTLPINFGEKVAIRILNESSQAVTLQSLGLWGPLLAILTKTIAMPHGLILVTGPTGSGKSTSLFSVLNIVNNPTVNISTIEDPIEYLIPGINQTQVNPKAGMTFSTGLRSLLRQDPNIIMVGEIRDKETADLTVQAALTGHLVFSTLHTNNAATSLPRLLDMGVQPFLISSIMRAVIGQRLVRCLCVNCRESFTPDESTIAQLSFNFHIDKPGALATIHELEKQAQASGFGRNPKSGNNPETMLELSSTDTGIKRIWKVHDGGCDQCNYTGYKGRIGIYEILKSSPVFQKLVMSGATSEAIQDNAVSEGMITMMLDGFIKALRGITSIEEILRVTVER